MGSIIQTPTIYTVGPGGSPTYDYGSIQDGIDACSSGDKVMVYNGTYTTYTWDENLLISGINIIVESVSGASRCIIDGGQNGSVVQFVAGCNSSCRLEGFTIQNGDGTVQNGKTCGGGIFIAYSGPTIKDCIIKDNSVGNSPDYGKGGGVYIGDNYTCEATGTYSPTLLDCEITENYGGKGGAVYIGYIDDNTYDVNIEGCVIEENETTANGHIFCSGANATTWPDLTIEECKIGDNDDIYYNNGYWDVKSLYLYECDTVNMSSNWVYGDYYCLYTWECNTLNLINDTYAQADGYAGAFFWDTDGDGTVNMYNTIVWDNETNYNIYVDGPSDVVVNIDYCCFQYGELYIDTYNNPTINYGIHNEEDAPSFVNSAAFNFHLDTGSNCIDSGNNSKSPMATHDVDGDRRIIDGDGDQTATVDIGGDEYTT